MTLSKTVWSVLFRLFPCPVPVGLHRIGSPGRGSPVLLTCNFYLTVKRLKRVLRGTDAWLLVAESRGVNVWCAAGGDEFNTHSVVSVLKTSGIADRVDHRTVILPPLGGPGIRAVDVEKQTGWSVKWGPVKMTDLSAYLAGGMRRQEKMKRVTFDWKERLDVGLGSLFPFYFLFGLGFALFGRHLLADYLIIGAAAFVIFMLAEPWMPGERGIVKVLWLNGLLAVGLLATWIVPCPGGARVRADVIIAMVAFSVYGFELGGLASTMASELDPMLARLGIGAVGNLDFAGSVRTDLLNGNRRLVVDPVSCIGCRRCAEICPQGVWELSGEKHAILSRPAACTACRACLVQCPSGAIQAASVA